jgi:Class II flagellar assembly regulator
MKVESGRPIGAAAGARRAGAGGAAPGFAPVSQGPQSIAAAQAASPAASIESILALQAEGFDAERRARQARRGRSALDALEDLARGLVNGRASGGLRATLEALSRGGEPTGEPGLDAILLEIDTRLAVELAKLEMAAV